MKKYELLQMFNEGTSGKNHIKGQRIIDNDLVSSIDIISEENLICVDGRVISESLFNKYKTIIEIDGKSKSILSTFCSCADYEKNEFKKENYCCKHLVATFYKALKSLQTLKVLNTEHPPLDSLYKDKSGVLDILLGDEKDKEEIKIEVYINKHKWNNGIKVEFKIGSKFARSSDLNVLKDVNQFLLAYYNNFPVIYSKTFTFHKKTRKLNVKDKRLIDFTENLWTLDKNTKAFKSSREKNIDGKYINIPEYMVREFFHIIKNHRVYLNEGFFSRPVETEIIIEDPEIRFELNNSKGNYSLKVTEGMPSILEPKNEVLLYGTNVYLPSFEFCYKIRPYFEIFSKAKIVTIPISEEDTILRRLIPDLNSLSPMVSLSNSIQDKIVIDSCKFNFYFDRQDEIVTLKVKVRYGAFEFNIFKDFKEKVIYRAIKKEEETIGIIKALGFEEINGVFHFLKDDDYIFNFFKNDIERLQKIGEVYYSENFKGLKYIGTKGINAQISSGKYDYFDMDFNIGDISSKETMDIIRSFRDNLKYYKLESGEYLDLQELELNKFLKLLDSVSSFNVEENHIEISKNKAVFLDSYIEENNIRYIKGKGELKKVKDRLKDIEKLKFNVPSELKGTLREYQKIGYNWLKTLDYLGFGGILADEMGLGKTIQIIAFLLSNKGSKSLIVAPTSLIYNWINEFHKFAPNLKVVAINGPKEERECILENIEDVDVLITTYNLLKRDIDLFCNLEFDYCILDEAQNIKNYNSQNSIASKSIKARTRFALSGTPLENSLMDLWSIFDFIMPGYLYDEKRFSVRYQKRLKEEPEVLEDLNRLIKPFILRRKKSDVLKELPEKIEKVLLVNLEEEQKKVYKAYADYVARLIEKKVKDDEFKNSKIEILSYITKLRQLCLDPTILMTDYTGDSGKLIALLELIQGSIEEGHRILIFSQFTTVLKNIGERIKAEGIGFNYLDGSISSEKRIELVNSFNEGRNAVFLISLKAGGTGLNLTSADTVIHFDPWWNPAVEEQATDRAHRIGQKNVVEVIKIIAKGTIEEKILLLQEEKKRLISEFIGDESSKGEGFSSLNEEELLGLFK